MRHEAFISVCISRVCVCVCVCACVLRALLPFSTTVRSTSEWPRCGASRSPKRRTTGWRRADHHSTVKPAGLVCDFRTLGGRKTWEWKAGGIDSTGLTMHSQVCVRGFQQFKNQHMFTTHRKQAQHASVRAHLWSRRGRAFSLTSWVPTCFEMEHFADATLTLTPLCAFEVV